MERASTGLAALLLALITANGALAGDTYPQLVEQGYRVDALTGIGRSGLVALDIDSDGALEVVFSASSGGQTILAALDTRADGSFRIAHERFVFPDDIVRVLGRSVDDRPHVLTLGRNGIVREYATAPFVELRHFQTQPQAITAALGDVDGDGQQDLVVLTPTAVLAYALADGHLTRTYAAAGFNDLALAQLDADPALEIVLTGDNAGRVLDGATSATEWDHPEGFGRKLTAGRFGPNGALRWAGATWADATVYEPWTAAWTVAPATGVQGVGHAADGPMTDVLVVEEYGGTFSVYDTDQTLRFRFVNEGYALSGIVGADADADGRKVIVFASGDAMSPLRSMGVVDVQTGQLLDKVVTTNGPYIKTAIGDVDGDGRQEIVAAASQYAGAAALALFDLATGELKWKSPYDWPSTHTLSSTIVDVALVPRSSGGGSDVALLDSQGSLRVIDSTTFEPTLWVAGANSEGGKELALIDYDRDGVQDFVIATKVGPSSGGQLKVLSGRDGASLWRSVHMGGMFTTISQVVVADASADGGPRHLIAVLSDGLRAYDADTGFLDWVLDMPSASVGYARKGTAGAELIVYSGGELRFYDGTQRGTGPTLLRQYALSAPVKAFTPLDEDVRSLLAVSQDRLLLMDGTTGEVRESSQPMTLFSDLVASPLSVVRQSINTWQVVAGTVTALYRYRVVLDEAIFSDGLDGR